MGTDPGGAGRSAGSRLRSENAARQDWPTRSMAEYLDPAERATLAAAIPLLHRLGAADPADSPGARP